LFVDGSGGISAVGISFVLDIEQIHPDSYTSLTNKIIMYISVSLSEKTQSLGDKK